MDVRRLSFGLAAFCFVGCGAEPEVLPAPGHLLVHVNTDAWIPTSASSPPGERPPLFDSLQIEVLRPDEGEPCSSCVQVLPVDAETLDAGGTFSIRSEEVHAGLRLRVSMFLASHQHGIAIDPMVSVQTTVLLPTIPEEGAADVYVMLWTDTVGAPAGTVEAPIPASIEDFGASLARSWPAGRVIDCVEPAAAGEVCVPGGAYWMGNRRAGEVAAGPQSTGRRLVTMPPFFIDAREATAGDIRQPEVGNLNPFIAPWSGDDNGDSLDDWCSYSAALDPVRDRLPMNCIEWGGAQAYCETYGKTLPTEAQYEYVAGATEGRDFVWGSEVPSCDDAVLARATGIAVSNSGAKAACAHLLAPGELGGPVALPQGATSETVAPPRSRDVLALPTGDVFDLAGNVAEWMADWFQPSSSPCWRQDGPNLFHAPFCDDPSSSVRSFRGGRFEGWASTALAAAREANAPNNAVNQVGFRCVRPATGASRSAPRR
jgi:formylglycine-generating enzyme required for sulfatase activity